MINYKNILPNGEKLKNWPSFPWTERCYAPIRISEIKDKQSALKRLCCHVPGRLHAVIKKAVVIVWSRLIALWVL